MNQPLRLARGEMLYSDVRHIYGPLSPYINALLYKIFGPSLTVLYADGIVTAILILAAVYWLSRRLMGRPAAAATTLSVMWLCAFKQAGKLTFFLTPILRFTAVR
jgi:4-amino-4-deoxy-L-arabinose transferase-like glycosyltransferase